MSFEPQDFLLVAKFLAENENAVLPDNARIRTAISRAYYAAYLVARRYAERNGLKLESRYDSRGGVHQQLLNALEEELKTNRGKGKGQIFAFEQLLASRKLADYELGADIGKLQNALRDGLQHAKVVINCYSPEQ